MRDPFFEAPSIFIRTCRPVADWLSLQTLPLHLHEVFFAWAFYKFIHSAIAPTLSARLFPKLYPKLSAKTRIDWDVRVVSLVQACLITSLTLYVLFNDDELNGTDWKGRIWGYSGACGTVQAFAAGYFIWDVSVSASYLKFLGPGSLAHACSALLVTSLGFRPFANYYGMRFVLYALSTPFLNFHWYFDKVGLTGSRLQLYNGIALLAVFFCCRVLWGNYQSINIYQDVWEAMHTSPIRLPLLRTTVYNYRMRPDLAGKAIEDPSTVALPMWLAILYLGSNTILNLLNIYWFSRMIQTVRSRFQPAQKPGKEATKGEKRVDKDVISTAVEDVKTTSKKRPT